MAKPGRQRKAQPRRTAEIQAQKTAPLRAWYETDAWYNADQTATSLARQAQDAPHSEQIPQAAAQHALDELLLANEYPALPQEEPCSPMPPTTLDKIVSVLNSFASAQPANPSSYLYPFLFTGDGKDSSVVALSLPSLLLQDQGNVGLPYLRDTSGDLSDRIWNFALQARSLAGRFMSAAYANKDTVSAREADEQLDFPIDTVQPYIPTSAQMLFTAELFSKHIDGLECLLHPRMNKESAKFLIALKTVLDHTHVRYRSAIIEVLTCPMLPRDRAFYALLHAAGEDGYTPKDVTLLTAFLEKRMRSAEFRWGDRNYYKLHAAGELRAIDISPEIIPLFADGSKPKVPIFDRINRLAPSMQPKKDHVDWVETHFYTKHNIIIPFTEDDLCGTTTDSLLKIVLTRAYVPVRGELTRGSLCAFLAGDGYKGDTPYVITFLRKEKHSKIVLKDPRDGRVFTDTRMPTPLKRFVPDCYARGTPVEVVGADSANIPTAYRRDRNNNIAVGQTAILISPAEICCDDNTINYFVQFDPRACYSFDTRPRQGYG